LIIDYASGKVVKTYQTGSPIRYQPVVEGGRIYVGTQDGRLICVDTGNKEFTGWSMWDGNAARTGIQEAIQQTTRFAVSVVSFADMIAGSTRPVISTSLATPWGSRQRHVP
jgi:outer membrane protein assembly factor BamB